MQIVKADPSLVAGVFITNELYSRPAPAADYLEEKMALQDLAAHMAGDPAGVLPRFVELAMQMTGGTSAGLSLYEEGPPPGVFRWQNLCGKFARFEGATTNGTGLASNRAGDRSGERYANSHGALRSEGIQSTVSCASYASTAIVTQRREYSLPVPLTAKRGVGRVFKVLMGYEPNKEHL